MTGVSVIVVSYNTCEPLAGCLQSVLTESLVDGPIWAYFLIT
jgi:hypothetical protein